LLLKTTDVCIGFCGCLVELHDGDHRIGVVLENTNDGLGLVVKEDRAARLEEVFVDKAHNRDVALRATARRDDGVVVINDLLEGADCHGATTDIINARSLLLVLVLSCNIWRGSLESLLICDIFLFHEQVVFDALCLEQAETTATGGEYGWQLLGWVRTAFLLLSDACWEWWFPFLLCWLVWLLKLDVSTAVGGGRDARTF